MPIPYNPSSRPETAAQNAANNIARQSLENTYQPHPGDSPNIFTDTNGNFRAVDPVVPPSSFAGVENNISGNVKTNQQEAASYRDAILSARRTGQIDADQANQLFKTPYQDGKQILKEILNNGPTETTTIPNGRVEGSGGARPTSNNTGNGGNTPIPDSVVEGALPKVAPEVAVGVGVAGTAATVAAEGTAIPTIGSVLGGAAAAIAGIALTPELIALAAVIGGLGALDLYLRSQQNHKIANQQTEALKPFQKAGQLYKFVCKALPNPKGFGVQVFDAGIVRGPVSKIEYSPDVEYPSLDYDVKIMRHEGAYVIVTGVDANNNPEPVQCYISTNPCAKAVIDHVEVGYLDKYGIWHVGDPSETLQVDPSGKTNPETGFPAFTNPPLSPTATPTKQVTLLAPPATLPGQPNTPYKPSQFLPQHQDQQAKRTLINVPVGKVPQVSILQPGGSPTVIFTPTDKPSQVDVGRQKDTNGKVPITIKNPDTLIPTIISTEPDKPVTIQSPGSQPITVNPTIPVNDPNTTGQNKTIEPTIYPGTVQEPKIYEPQKSVEGGKPSLFQPNTVTPSKTTPVTTPLTPTTPQEQSNKNKDIPIIPDLSKPDLTTDIISRLIEVTTILSTIKNNTTPESIATGAATGTCRTTQPGGCMNKLVNQAGNDTADKVNKNSNGLFDNLKNWFNTAILAPIMSLLTRVGAVVGIGVFPATVPASFIASETAVAEATVGNIPELMAWQAGRLDELTGQFPIPIEVPGGQKLSIPNMAEGIAELIGMGLANAANSEMMLNLSTRGLTEGGQIKQQGFKTYMAIEAVIEYLNFKHKEVQHQMPLSFKPGETDLMSLIQENMQTVSVIEFDDKLTQRTILLDLAQAAAITRARGFQATKGGTEAEIKEELVARIKHLSQYSEGLITEKKDAQGLDSIDKFNNQIMHGYPDNENPYACDGEQPPEIKRQIK